MAPETHTGFVEIAFYPLCLAEMAFRPFSDPRGNSRFFELRISRQIISL